ncbi:NADH-quinone oxidoreductase subunit J [Salipaludibacillus keqinensis]|uniref:NADH-quinone oxidoreductase subunit J n=1 Tax=Salipaludibacillus keqinensis TaxID=2045207 RepID=A0A323TBK5_9BACI|nr:NADH-quinone oxidoreductase subunit J [Salipaludibacillus keqinensis]PYZ92509.1 NADH-quinone oxidoreductase subunit J [Salipaludibacillus keqinensis]
MNTQMIFFIILALIAIVCAVLIMALERISHRVVSMAFSFFAVAGLYFLLGAEFIGIIQVMVYVGAITILFVFGMMMTEHRNVGFGPDPRKGQQILGFLGAATLLGVLLYGIFSMDLPTEQPYVGTVEAIGLELYGHYFIAFLGSGFLLTSALIGAVVIARKEVE